jgi:succinate dehydrogenase/fumarate reductase flavoprotein subunit
MPEQFDLVILGAGSTAFAAALRAAESGKTVALGLLYSRFLQFACSRAFL